MRGCPIPRSCIPTSPSLPRFAHFCTVTVHFGAKSTRTRRSPRSRRGRTASWGGASSSPSGSGVAWSTGVSRGGLLVARFHGVYALGDLHLTLDGHRTAAVLAVPGGRLSHGDCCALHGVGGGGGAFWDLTVPGHGGRRRRGQLRVHATTTFRPHDLAVVGGLPCTSLPRAIADAAQVLDRRRMANVLAEAERRRLLHLAALREAMERVKHRPTPAHALLVHVLTEHLRHGAQLTRSEVEEALREIAVRAGLPAPLMNRVIGGDELDAWWPDVGLGIEVDSWEFHDHRRSFVTDRAKLRRLFLRGVVVLPYAAADLVHRPQLVAPELAALRRQAVTLRRSAA